MRISTAGRSWLSGLLLLASLGLTASCGQEDGADRTTASARGALATTVDPASQLRAAYVAARQAEGAKVPVYTVRAGEDGAFVATHPVTHLRADLGARGVVLSMQGEPWRATVAVAHVGCGVEEGMAVERASARPRSSGSNRVEYAERAKGAGITEWYVHGPLGLEQGITLAATRAPTSAPTPAGTSRPWAPSSPRSTRPSRLPPKADPIAAPAVRGARALLS